VVLALTQLGHGLDGGDMRTVIGDVIPNLAAAFVTSIIGVVCAMVTGAIAHSREHTLLKNLHLMVEAIDRLVQRLSQQAILEEQQLNLLPLQKLESIDTSLQSLGSNIADALEKRLTSVFENQIGARLGEIVTIVKKQVEHSSNAAQANAGEVVSHLTHGLEDAFSGIATSVTTAAENIGNTSGELKNMLEGLAEVSSRQVETVGESNEAIKNAGAQQERFAATMSQVDGLTQGLGQLLTNLASQQQDAASLQVQQETIQKNAQSNISEMGQSFTEFQKNYKTIAGDFERVLSATAERCESLSASVQTLSGVSQSTATQVQQTVTTLTARSKAEEQLLTQYQGVSKQFSQALTQGSSVVVGFQNTATSLDTLSKTFSEHTRGVGQLTTSLNKTLEALATTSSEVSASLAKSRDSAGALEAHFGVVERSTKELSDANAKLFQVHRQGMEDANALWVKQTETALVGFGEKMSSSISDSLVKFDQTLAKAIGQLSTNIGELDNLAEELNDWTAQIDKVVRSTSQRTGQ